jgi:oxygen-independent coproporphyrinogen-3 oxidase
MERFIPDYVQALCSEIEYVRQSAGQRLSAQTVFFGGGTPSLLPPADIEAILNTVHQTFDLSPGAEITLEANPGTLTGSQLKDLRKLGVNRLSLGMQSAHPEELRILERQHDFPGVIQSVKWARQAGFDNLNLDLMFGIPYQTLDAWGSNLEFARNLHPEHLSLYSLTLEHGTPMQHWTARGLLPETDPDLSADMYELAMESLEGWGFEQYEISNWARRDEQGQTLSSRHNLQYWRNLPYFGFGAGAHGYVSGVRTVDALAPAAYIDRCRQAKPLIFPHTPATVSATVISQQDEIGETMMMGLRLVQEGVPGRAFEERFDRKLEDVFASQIERLQGLGLLEWAGDGENTLRLTKRGRLLGNQVFMEFI